MSAIVITVTNVAGQGVLTAAMGLLALDRRENWPRKPLLQPRRLAGAPQPLHALGLAYRSRNSDPQAHGSAGPGVYQDALVRLLLIFYHTGSSERRASRGAAATLGVRLRCLS